MTKKFKLVKEYPQSPLQGTIVTKDKHGQYVAENPLLIFQRIDIELYPEFWQEVKEPLFTTIDGYEVFEGDDYIFITEHWIAVTNIKGSLYHNTETRPRFKVKELAEQFISENKPIYSKKQIKEAFQECGTSKVAFGLKFKWYDRM
jgi:hypothetical protein